MDWIDKRVKRCGGLTDVDAEAEAIPQCAWCYTSGEACLCGGDKWFNIQQLYLRGIDSLSDVSRL